MVREIAMSGRLRDERLPGILTRLQRLKKTGTLVVRRNDQHKLIYLKNGDIIFAASKYQDDWLGEMLLKLGKITLKQYDAASEVTRATQKRFGTVLVEHGVLAPKDLFWAVGHQVKEIILSLFTWLDGEYAFEEGPLPAQEIITLRMSTANLILDGIRRINDFTRLRNELPPMNSILQITTDPLILFQDINLAEPERKTLSHFDGRNTLYEVFGQSELPVFDTLKLVCFFLSVGMIEINVTELVQEDSRPEKPAAKTETAREAPPRARPSGVKTQEKFVQGLAEEVRLEKQEAVKESQEQIFRKNEQEAQMSQQKIREAHDAMQRQDFYEILGLHQEATRDEIKRAYFRLAKEYHPDRHFQTGLDDLTPVLEALFRRITEAYDTLLMERKRKEYDTELVAKKFETRRGARTSPSGGAAGQVTQGEQALQKGDFKTAAYYFEAAVTAAPDKGSYHALLAKALTQIPGRQRDAETHFKQAVELDPANVEHYIGLGLLYKKGGMAQRAQRQFEEALVWDPDNQTAKAELKKLQT